MKSHNYFKKGFIVLITMLTLSTVCSAEEITLTTYYPSPYGVYSEMRLYPKPSSTTPCDPANPASQRGVLYYDSDDNQIKVCVGSAPSWQPLGGGFWTQAGSSLYPNNNSWNVGIGTNNPQAKVDIGGFSNGRKLLLGQSPGGDTGFVVSDDTLLTGKFGGVFVAQPINGSRLVLASYRGNPVSVWTTTDSTGAGFQERLTILGSGINAGNVGIGTTDPLQLKLYLNANVPTPAGRNGMQISTPLGHYVSLGGGIGTDGSNTAGLHIGNQAGQNFGGEGGTLYYDYDAPDRSLVAASAGGIRIAALGQYPPAGRDIIFATNPSNIERMRITDAGNVGIGTTAPGVKLHVMGDMGSQWLGEGPYGDYFYVNRESGRPVVRIADGGSYYPVLQFVKGSSWMNLEYTGSALQIGGNTGSTVLISGIAVGGAFPGYSAAYPWNTIGMDWNGGLRINFGSTERYVFYNNGQAYAAAGGGWYVSSDQRFKENVVELTDVVRALKNIRGVRFDWKTKDFPQKGLPEGTQVGFIAQEIEQEFPELVATDSQGYKSLDYGKLTPVLLEAIKEQQAKIESLEARIEALEKRQN